MIANVQTGSVSGAGMRLIDVATSADAGRYALPAALTLLSGAVMMLAGYIAHTENWTVAGFITLPGGVVILAALSFARRANGVVGGTNLGAAAATVLSGGVMVLAGTAASAWGWVQAVPLAGVGAILITSAFALDRRRRGRPK